MALTQPEPISAIRGIDLTDLSNRRMQISTELMAAATQDGFFYVTGKLGTSLRLFCNRGTSEECITGHGLAQADIDAAFAMSVRSATAASLHRRSAATAPWTWPCGTRLCIG